MTVYYKENIIGLVDEVMAEWSDWYPGYFGVHTQVFYDKEDGSFFQESNMADNRAEFPYSYSCVEVVNITRPDDFFECVDAVRDEVEGTILDGMNNLGI